MNHSDTLVLSPSIEQIETKSKVIPTYIYASVFASFCIATGLLWDISWHMTVGRDGLLSPPHMVIYLGAVISGVFSGVKVLKNSFWASKEEKAENIKFWGIFHGSLGAMFCIWGAFAMLTSAPFDDWWHNTYGLDVKILSPPHALLGLGMIMIQFGAMISVISTQNRMKSKMNGQTKTHLQWLFALSSGFLLVMVYTLTSEYFNPNSMHQVFPYQVAAIVFPLFIVSVALASPFKFAATKMAVIYMLTMAGMVWLLPLFSAEPLLSPVLNHVDRFQPYHFPMLLVIPALAVDFVMIKYKDKNKWLLAAMLAVAFLILFLPTQWHFSEFLLTEQARGWVFGRFSLPYFVNPDGNYRYMFYPGSVDSIFNLGIGLLYALLIGILSSRIALAWGNWMSQVKR
ncbi:hypothetical protein [Belliella aquatica]|uniref:Uncharacterized protein n=1 Tax=Belliella aquatica TaxID=1323734 RepID=A0ABQ1MFY8_9BACT|nr:hypothetical protein [Belliella aquatica]MCH7405657.1 hypothetical protein [Belliella aquatica]GGC36772.1 hypothetical protein GCM10010993_14490 [Belliella aquatica]